MVERATTGESRDNIRNRITVAEGRLRVLGGEFRFRVVPEAALPGVEAALRDSEKVRRGLNETLGTLGAVSAFSIIPTTGLGLTIAGYYGSIERIQDANSGRTVVDLEAVREWIYAHTGVIMENFTHFAPQILAAEMATAVAAGVLLVVGKAVNAAVRNSRLGKQLGKA